MSDRERLGSAGIASITAEDIARVIDGASPDGLVIDGGLADRTQREGRVPRATPGRLVVETALATFNDNE